jgi:transcription elongation factor GreB
MSSLQTKNYITPAGLEKLRQEYFVLLQKERPKVVETVAWAASNGDRSENADYIYGKRRLREIDKRLRWLSDRLEKAEIVDPTQIKSAKIVFGATVTLSDEDGQEIVYQIVGEDETDVKAGKISWKSPVASALLGKKEDDEVVLKKPTGEQAVVVEKVVYLPIK